MADSEYGRLNCRDLTGNDLLEIDDDMGCNVHRVHAFFRSGAVAADSFYFYHKFIKGSHTAARYGNHGSCLDVLGNNRSDMGSEHSINAIHSALCTKPLSSSGTFFIGLEEQPYRAWDLIFMFT